jgi:hypothetical protein
LISPLLRKWALSYLFFRGRGATFFRPRLDGAQSVAYRNVACSHSGAESRIPIRRIHANLGRGIGQKFHIPIRLQGEATRLSRHRVGNSSGLEYWGQVVYEDYMLRPYRRVGKPRYSLIGSGALGDGSGCPIECCEMVRSSGQYPVSNAVRRHS